ncbi:MAG: heparinase II/III family protein, partial [Oscillospiraceae bacterium]|nr:heparinase II/III family protein [Oscillospiraceae bacterium]
LFENPKFVKMFYGMLNVTMADYGVQSGDSGTFAKKGLWLSTKQAMAAYRHIKDDVFLQALYLINGYSSNGIHEDIFTNNPEQIKEDMDRVISEKGTLSLDSEMLSGFGFAALRDGKRYSKEDDTRHGFWMFFGLSGAGHGHRDSLNIGMDAFGLNFLPDLGYPTSADSQPRTLQWDARTLSHNTVMVNEIQQDVTQQRGKSLHFDATENVQLMDVEAPDAYRGSNVSEYRRSVIMIKIDEDNFYGLDLFRVKGGWSHEFSLHAQSDEIGYTSGVNFVPQVGEDGKYKGNYAGIDVDSNPTGAGYAGPDPNSPITATYNTVYPRGYTWLENVDRGTPTSDKIELDFNIKDFRKTLSNSKGLHLRATMLGIAIDSEVNTVTGYAPNKKDNESIPGIRYAFVKRKSGDKNTELDTLFTTVYEPYRDTRTLSDISELVMTVSAGEAGENDIARCVKVTHADGERIDYIFYATNNKVTYTVTDGDKNFTFRGFVGVITMKNGADIYKYICDGDILDEVVPQKKAINARVTYFTESSEFENEIHIKPLDPLSAEEIKLLPGRYIYVENGNVRNVAYKIENAKSNGNEIILDIGDCTLITGQIDPYEEDKVGNYKYSIAKRADCVIPLSWSENNAPWVNEVSDKTVSAGNSLTFEISGASPIDNMSTSLSLRIAPRGASLNSETGAFTWKPDASQVGTHVITVLVTDTDGRQSVTDFKVEVYGSTTGSSSSDKTESPSDESAGGGSGGGGGDAAPTDKPDTETTPDDA